ncbi:hypothetical protein CAPTEDRAFT_26654, partial [Capitella teleta]
YITPYGIQLQWVLDFGMPFFIHLKDPNKVKPKKRWSQVMYMAYVLNYRMKKTAKKIAPQTLIDQLPAIDPSIFDTYILATDADMEFSPDSVQSLLDVCRVDRRLGGVCGRTHPVGQKAGPLIWYQMFEYAKDFWMIKSAQNVIGSVMCCPGCFSLYRVSAIREVMAQY